EGRSGRLDYDLMCIVAEGPNGRIYTAPQDSHLRTAQSAKPDWIPDTDLPEHALGFRIQRYGMIKHRDIYTSRQILALTTFSNLIGEVHKKVFADSGDVEYANTISTLLALGVDRLAQTNNTLIRWLVRKSGTSKGTPAFDRPIVSMVWEFS